MTPKEKLQAAKAARHALMVFEEEVLLGSTHPNISKGLLDGIEAVECLIEQAEEEVAEAEATQTPEPPADYTSWNEYFRAWYPRRALELGDQSYSAPRELEKIEDPVYLKLKENTL